ncbi:MAG: PIN domain-containing protein, partial [Limisphaerales bacterium]
AGLRSPHGASAALISAMPSRVWTPALSVPLYIQYQDVLLRPGMVPGTLAPDDILVFCRYLASISHLQEVYFLWRPHLSDAGDDMVFEVAVAAQARYIVTYNVRDFRGVEELGIVPVRPPDFLALIRQLS